LLGLSEFETEDFPGAFSHLRRAQALGIENPPELANVAVYHLGLLLNLRGEADAARSLLSKLVRSGVNSEDLQVALGLSLLRVPLLPKQLDPSKDALIHDAGSVAALLARREFEQADAAFRDLLKKYPGASFIHYAYGSMLASRGQDEPAIAQLKAETEVTPESALAYMEWAFLEFNAQHYSDALPPAETAVKLAPNASLARYLVGGILLAQDAAAAAIPHLEMARRLAPSSPEVHYSLARAYAKVGKRDLAKHEQQEFTRLQAGKRNAEEEETIMGSFNSESASGPGTSRAPQQIPYDIPATISEEPGLRRGTRRRLADARGLLAMGVSAHRRRR
jgi:predicted Zn-dependent protease